jgi:hypothetical protein
VRSRSSPGLVENAERVARTIVETYLAPNKNLCDLHEMPQSDWMDPLRSFIEACREELRSLKAGAGVPGLGNG